MPLSLSRIAQNVSHSATLALNAAVARLRAQGADILSLGAGEPDFPTPASACKAACAAMQEGRTRYTDVSGILPLRQAISERLLVQRNIRYAPQDIIITAGAKQALHEALLAILNPGDEVLLPAPYWISYPEMIRMAGGIPVILPAQQNFLPAFAALKKAITPRTKALIINTPNNPSGTVWPHVLLDRAVQLAKEHDFFIISDEIYEDFVYDGCVHLSPASFADAHDRTIVISGLSKAYAMTGWRVGYAAGPHHVISAMSALQSQSSGNACSIAQYAALGALEDTAFPQNMARCFDARRRFLLEKLADSGLSPMHPPQGAFYLLLPIHSLIGKKIAGETITSDVTFADLLLRHAHIAVVPGAEFGAPGYVRISYAVQEATLDQAIDRMKHFLDSLQ